MEGERWPLLAESSTYVRSSFSTSAGGLSVFFTTLCIIDLFGVFPVMTLPRAIIDCGWMGLPLALTVFGLQVYTAVLLGRCWIIAEHIDPEIITKSRYPYSALVEMSFGKHTSKFVTVLLDIAVFGGGVPNLLVASQNLQLLGLKMSETTVDISYCYWLITLGVLLCPIMWLGSPKDMKWVAVVSVTFVFAVAVLTWTCMLNDLTSPTSINVPRPSWESFAIAYGILAFQFDIHPMILTVQVDMKNKADLGYAITWSFVVTGSLFVVSTTIAMLKYGSAIRYNALQGLPGSGLLYLDLLLVTIQICLSMVVGASALFQDIENRMGVPRQFNWKRCVIRSALMMFTVLIGEVVPRFDLIMGLIGGALTGPLMFVFPPLLYIRYRQLQTLRRRHETSSSQHSPIEDPSIRDQERFTSQYCYCDVYCGTSDFNSTNRGIIPVEDQFDFTKDNATEETSIKSFLSLSYGTEELSTSQRECFKFRTLEDETTKSLSMEVSLYEEPLTISEGAFIVCILLLGLLATCAATFYSVRDAIRYAQFTPACFP